MLRMTWGKNAPKNFKVANLQEKYVVTKEIVVILHLKFEKEQ